MLKINKTTKVGILGLGITGVSIYNYLLYNYYPDIICFDEKEANLANFSQNALKAKIVPLNNNLWKKLDIIFISPGIQKPHIIFDFADENKIPVRSDIDLLYAENPHALFICITGSNGKTTTTMLISEILKRANLNFAFGGNIGIPVLELEKNKNIYLLELSSFQADLVRELTPKITILLNLFPNHLDTYQSTERYYQAKKNLIDRSEVKIIGICNEMSKNIFEFYKNQTKSSKSKVISFKNKEEFKYKTDFTIEQNLIKDRFLDFEEYYIQNNKHLINPNTILCAYIITKFLNIKTENLFHALENFVPPKYRLELLGKKDNISFYNDSKSTNTSATYFALSALENILLIIGGVFKEKNLLKLKNMLHKINKAFIIGENTEIFEKFFRENNVKYELSISLSRAFSSCLAFAQKLEKSTILLSPAAASFDQFNNFEHRGAIFSELVHNFLYEHTI